MSVFPGKVQSRTVFLRWRSADLIAMLARRFLSVLRRTEAVDDFELARLERLVEKAYAGSDGWNLRTEFWYDTGFLPRSIKNTLDKEEDTFAYILRHTMRRPRDLITAQMQSIVNEAVDRKKFPKITIESVVAGVHNSGALLQILKETLTMFDEKAATELVDIARTVFYQTPVKMTGPQLKLFAKRLYDAYPPENINPDDFVKHL